MPIILKMQGGKCGCVFCKNGGAPNTKSGWMAQKNKYGRMYGHGKSSRGKGKS